MSTRAILRRACASVGIAGPRPRQHERTWIDATVRAHADAECDPLWKERAPAYLHAAWALAARGELEECVRMLHGARTMLRIGNDVAYAFETNNDRHLDDGLYAIVCATARELRLEIAGPEASLVVYLLDGAEPVLHDWLWSEADGLEHTGYMLDDGRWREGFSSAWEASEAARSWPQRKKGVGRGLPYVDSPWARSERIEKASDPATPPALLIELAGDADEDVCIAVAKNPSAPIEALRRLAELPDGIVLLELCARPGLPTEIVDRLAPEDESFLRALVLDGNASERVLAELRRDASLRASIVCDLHYARGWNLEALAILADDDSLREEVLETVPPAIAEALRARPAVPPGSILRRTYRIQRWARWDDEVHASAEDFRSHFGVYPNVLLANAVTFARIDMAAKKQNIRGTDGEQPEGWAPLSEFVGPGYTLMFAVSEQLRDAEVALLWDGDPDGGGEVPEEDTPVSSASVQSVG